VTSSPDLATAAIDDLRSALNGRVITSGDPGYDEGRTVFIGGIDRRPSAIVRVADTDDVARVILQAREAGLELAVRGGGHSGAGHGVTDGGIVLDLREMRGLDIDVDGRTAWAQTGLSAGDYTTAAAAHGLATGFGDVGTVGIGGITLGGGVGYLSRKHGLTIDDLLAAEVVTADGEVLQADAESHPDLFWAVRGGGGNFGVATRLRFRLHELDSIVGGMLVLPATPESIASFVAAAEEGPEELATIAAVRVGPPPPFVPPEHHDELLLMASVAYAGPADAGERAIAPLRAVAEPIADMVRPMPYPEIFPPEMPDYHPIGASRTLFVDRFDDAMAETIVERLSASTAGMAVAQLRILGGAIARVPADATAFAHRRRRIMANLAAIYERPEEGERHWEWVDGFAAGVRSGDDTAAYVNFLVDEGEPRVRDAYPGSTWDRLVEVKRRYDPDNVFRLNQNIPPSG
jgi:FAD/FMN-containing dehydrogenase